MEPSDRKSQRLPQDKVERHKAWQNKIASMTTDVERLLREAQQKEDELRAEWKEWDENHPTSSEEAIEFDHADFFTLPATHGLHRLLPRQTLAMGKCCCL